MSVPHNLSPPCQPSHSDFVGLLWGFTLSGFLAAQIVLPRRSYGMMGRKRRHCCDDWRETATDLLNFLFECVADVGMF
jgi:hypothetical protein